MNQQKGDMGIKKVMLTVGMLVAVLAVLALMLSMLMGGAGNDTGSSDGGECAQQENEEDCTSLTTDNWVGENRQKCFWDDETETCGPRVN